MTLSKNGALANAGAVICEDFDLQSARGSLSKEDLKTLFDVRDGGTVESKRYGTIDFPPGLPRLFSFNSEATIVLSIFGKDQQMLTAVHNLNGCASLALVSL